MQKDPNKSPYKIEYKVGDFKKDVGYNNKSFAFDAYDRILRDIRDYSQFAIKLYENGKLIKEEKSQ